MAHRNPSDPELKNLLTEARTIAMIGASSNPDKASYGIMQQLQKRGYHVIPINPRETEVLGERARLARSTSRSPSTSSTCSGALRYARDRGRGGRWREGSVAPDGIVSDDAAARAEAGGLLAVMDACIAATHALLRCRLKRADLLFEPRPGRPTGRPPHALFRPAQVDARVLEKRHRVVAAPAFRARGSDRSPGLLAGRPRRQLLHELGARRGTWRTDTRRRTIEVRIRAHVIRDSSS
jgi:predicted CoA-binding protein